MQKILLVQPVIVVNHHNPKKYVFAPGNELPLNILYLAGFLEKDGHDHRILDLRVCRKPWDVLETTIREYDPDIVGVTACSCEIWGAHLVAETVKKIDSSILTIVGGIHVSSLPVKTLAEFPAFDMVVYGEGEHTLTEIVRNVANGTSLSSISGTAIRQKGQIHINPPRKLISTIDEIPFPSRHLINNQQYFPNPITYNHKSIPTTGIIASRGCPYNCSHCSKGVWKNTVRYRSAQNVFLEMTECIKKLGIRDFRFYDDVLTPTDGPLVELCHLIIENELNVSFNCYSRIDHITFDLLKLMKRAGCYHIKYGVESSSARALSLSNRNTTYEQAKTAIDLTRKAGILVKAAFIMGMPGETEETFYETIQLSTKLRPDLASFGLFTLFPGSKFYTDYFNGITEIMDSRVPVEKVLPYISRAYSNFYFRFGFISQHIAFLFRHPDFIPSEIKRTIRGVFTLLWFGIRRFFKLA
ncbi:B12-binding domain-containing radical SAM protein [bacterium]|nr:B12-binding domain-containing radical SAM protein [bacterium]